MYNKVKYQLQINRDAPSATTRSCNAKLPGRLHRLHLGCTEQNVVISHGASSQPVLHAALCDGLWEKSQGDASSDVHQLQPEPQNVSTGPKHGSKAKQPQRNRQTCKKVKQI